MFLSSNSVLWSTLSLLPRQTHRFGNCRRGIPVCCDSNEIVYGNPLMVFVDSWPRESSVLSASVYLWRMRWRWASSFTSNFADTDGASSTGGQLSWDVTHPKRIVCPSTRGGGRSSKSCKVWWTWHRSAEPALICVEIAQGFETGVLSLLRCECNRGWTWQVCSVVLFGWNILRRRGKHPLCIGTQHDTLVCSNTASHEWRRQFKDTCQIHNGQEAVNWGHAATQPYYIIWLLDTKNIYGLSLPSNRETISSYSVEDLKAMVIAHGGSVIGCTGKAHQIEELQKIVRAYLSMEA